MLFRCSDFSPRCVTLYLRARRQGLLTCWWWRPLPPGRTLDPDGAHFQGHDEVGLRDRALKPGGVHS